MEINKEILKLISIDKIQKKFGNLNIKPITSDQRFYFISYSR